MLTQNHLADVLSRRPVWLNPDHTLGPDEGLDLEDEEGFTMRVMERKPHLLRDNPLLSKLESIGNKDPEYSSIVHTISTRQGNKSLPSDSEAYKMGGGGT